MKHFFTLVFLFFLAKTSLNAQCVSGDCRDGSGIFLYPSGAKYIGQFKDGQIFGIGSCYYTDGSKYQGEWENGKPHGKGIRIAPDGRRTEGTWKEGKLVETAGKGASPQAQGEEPSQTGCISGDCRNGKGIYIYPSGAIYIGEFKNGEIHGVGVCYYSDGSKYQGQWVHRYPEGRGTKYYSDGSKRTGLWKMGQPVDETGRLAGNLAVENDGTDIQSGCISGDCQDGEGIFAYPDGSRFEGFFRDGKPGISGTFYYPNGNKYMGEFREGFPHGTGRLVKPDGQTLSGEWRQGEYAGDRPAQGKGCVEGDCQSGSGTYVFNDGARYVGSFLNGRPDGSGTVFYLNGERYEGGMADGSFNGRGTLFMMDGTQVSGYWKDGTYLGVRNPTYETPGRPDISSLPGRESFGNPDLAVWAVIIGVASYSHMPALRYTDDDAYRMYAFLKSPEGGALDDEHIRILVDEEATRDNIVKTMEDLFGRAGRNDLVMLYFSGHGLKGAFLPIDFDGYNQKLLHEEISEVLRKSPAKYKLCIADACHSGSLLAMRGGELPNTLENYYRSLARSDSGAALIMSSKSEETSLESSGLRQGVFSHFLIRGLKGEADADNDKVVTIQELFDFVYVNVRAYTGNRQSPVIKGVYDKNMTVAVRRK
jgi:hypothetical protein